MRRFTRVFVSLAVVAGLSSMLHAADPAIEVEAWAGQPFGVGCIRATYQEKWTRHQVHDVTYVLFDADRRTHYPAFSRQSVPGATYASQVAGTAAYFLFRGDQPISLTFDDGIGLMTQRVTPRSDAAQHKALLDRWSKHYFGAAQVASQSRSILPVVENYTAGMLARRLKLEGPGHYSWQGDDWRTFAGYFLGTEELRLALQQERLLGSKEEDEPLDTPLPPAASPPPIEIPEVGEIELAERLAEHVPTECFYVRFRSYADSRWFRDLLNTWGGSVREYSKDRSLDYGIPERLERQLALRETDLAKLLGEHVIGEMAFIGTDMFVREGASIGVLFEAKQGVVLSAAIATQRAQALAANSAVTEQKVEIAGHRVSFLSTSDNRVRSFYAVDGDIHLVTTSSTLVRRFYEAGEGKDSLAGLKEFRWALSKQPAKSENAVLMYLSDPFIRLMVSPAYRVEMTRRMRADADLELLELARLAAKGEEAANGTIDELIAGGFLPPHFLKRADGSRVVVDGDVVKDSLRGSRRSFLPVLDVEIERITKSEAEAYAKFVRFYRGLYERMDPAVAWIRRQDGGEGTTRVVFDLAVTPFTLQNLGGLARMLPPATKQRMAPVDGAILFAEARVQPDSSKDPSNRLFAGLLDHPAGYAVQHGQIVTPDWMTTGRPVFAGEHGRFARQWVSDRFEHGEDLGDGFYELKPRPFPPLNYGWLRDEWWVVGGDLAALRKVAPRLEVTEAEWPAQVRVHVGDIGRSRLAPLCRAGLYLHDRGASQSNARLLDTLGQQLRVLNDDALAAAELVLGARPACPLGGDYSKPGHAGNQPTLPGRHWTSTGWGQNAPETLGGANSVPEDYQPVLLEWFRGLDVEIRFEERTMWTHVELRVNERVGKP